MERMIMGPIGDTMCLGGYETEWDETGHNAISLIIVTFDQDGATSIQFGYIENGSLIMSKMHGSHGCSKRIVRLNHESEFVTGISGEVSGCGLIQSLTFHTNERKHEAFHLAVNSGNKHPPTKMEFHSGILEHSEFEGFFGAYDDTYLCTINFYVRHVFPDI